MKVNYPDTPTGKRTIRKNVYGNWRGYVSGRIFWEFGNDEISAQFWVDGHTLEMAYYDCWVDL